MRIHIVKKGDTLYQLSKKYNVPLDKLIEMNPQIANPDKLDIGMKVKVPSTSDLSPIPADSIAHKHVVKQGDTLWKLSKQWGIPLQTMIDANPQLNNPSILMTGQVINIPKVNEHGQMVHSSASTANVQQQNVPPHKKNTAPIPEEISMEQIEENVQPLQEEVKEIVEEIKEETKEEIKEETKEEIKKETKEIPQKIQQELKELGKSLQQNMEEGIVENIKENIKEQAKQSVEKSAIMNENLPVLPEMHAASKELSENVKPLASGSKKQHISSSNVASYTEHPFQQYNVPATQAYSANMQWISQPQAYSSNVFPMTANTSMYANMQAPAKKKDCGCGGAKAANKSPGMVVPYGHHGHHGHHGYHSHHGHHGHGGYPGLDPWANAHAYPSMMQPYSDGYSNAAANQWMPISGAASLGAANSEPNKSSSALSNTSPGSFASFANQGAMPFANDGAMPFANQGAMPFANDGAMPFANQGAMPFANDGAMPFANQGAMPFANDGAMPFANQGAMPFANDGAMSFANQGAMPFANDGAMPFANQGAMPFANDGAMPFANQGAMSFANQGAMSFANQGAMPFANQGAVPFANLNASSPSLQSTNAAANTHLSGQSKSVSNEKAYTHLSGASNAAAFAPTNSNIGPMSNLSGFGGMSPYANTPHWGDQGVIPYGTPIGGEWGQWGQSNAAANQANVNAAAANNWANPAPGTVFPNAHQTWTQSEQKGGKKREDEFSFADSGEEDTSSSAINKKSGAKNQKKKTRSAGKKTGKATLHSARTRSRSSRRFESNNPWINY